MATAMTVLGPIDSNKLGITLPHEHIFLDLSCYVLKPNNLNEATLLEEPVSLKNLYYMRHNPFGNRDNCNIDDMDVSLNEIKIFKEFGGNTIVDVTPDGIGRDVKRISEVSRRAGINIIVGCGHYIYSAHPEYIKDMSIDQLKEQYINEINNGIENTGIRPGIIGEIGTSAIIYPQELKVLRAAARAQVETGLAITIHLHPARRLGHEVLDILIKEEGVSPKKIILGHLEPALVQYDIEFQEGVDYIMGLAERGCYIQFDLCGNTAHFIFSKDISYWMPSDRERAKAISIFCKNGFSKQVLLSQDLGHKYYMREYGGWGYSHVLNEFRVYLYEYGVEPDTYKLFNKDNPERVIAIDK